MDNFFASLFSNYLIFWQIFNVFFKLIKIVTSYGI
jgi:hypothetical protein